jgi:hypothetical protein
LKWERRMDELSDFEIAWRAWARLGGNDRARFLRRVRARIAEEMAVRRAARGTASAYRGTSSLAHLTLTGVDLEPREIEPRALESLSLDW